MWNSQSGNAEVTEMKRWKCSARDTKNDYGKHKFKKQAQRCVPKNAIPYNCIVRKTYCMQETSISYA